ncbi:MAG: SPFH domain-containing protein [Candidatus Sericytochromatia bacterium]|nr:SPFH domain-containing protein [Candidatus Sericytochromatia bacterium]
MTVLYIFFAAIAIILLKSVVIISQAQSAIVENLGSYSRTLGPGLHWVVPFVERIRFRFDTRETLHDFEPTAMITKDNATVRINAVTYFRINEVKAAAYNVENYNLALENLIITTLRSLIGELELDECLNGRQVINTKLQGILDETTHPWGLKVSRVEIKEIRPMGEIADAMDKQMVAERTRRAQILEAEGFKRAAILSAEGAKESAVLKAEGERDVLRIRAQAEAEAALIEARAQANVVIVKAEAQQEAIRKVADALGTSGEEKYLQLRYTEALPEIAQGSAATIFLPPGFDKVAGMAAVAGQAFKGAAGVRPASTMAPVPHDKNAHVKP